MHCICWNIGSFFFCIWFALIRSKTPDSNSFLWWPQMVRHALSVSIRGMDHLSILWWKLVWLPTCANQSDENKNIVWCSLKDISCKPVFLPCQCLSYCAQKLAIDIWWLHPTEAIYHHWTMDMPIHKTDGHTVCAHTAETTTSKEGMIPMVSVYPPHPHCKVNSLAGSSSSNFVKSARLAGLSWPVLQKHSNKHC